MANENRKTEIEVYKAVVELYQVAGDALYDGAKLVEQENPQLYKLLFDCSLDALRKRDEFQELIDKMS